MHFPRSSSSKVTLAATVLFAIACGEHGPSIPSEPLMAPKPTASYVLGPTTTTVWDFVAIAGASIPLGNPHTFTQTGAGDIDASAAPVAFTNQFQVYSKGFDQPVGSAERGLGLCQQFAPGPNQCLGAADAEIGDPWGGGLNPSIFLDFTGLAAGSTVLSVTLASLQTGEGWAVYTSTDGLTYVPFAGSTGTSDGTSAYLPTITIPVPASTKYLQIAPGPGAFGNNYLVQSVTTVTTPPNLGTQGCTPGYWKQSQHFHSWTATGYTPGQLISTVFSVPGTLKVNNLGLGTYSLVNGLSFKGGSDLSGKAQILLRAAIASLLNTSNSSIQYGMLQADVINAVNAALATGDATQITNLATKLDGLNNGRGGCPLN